jgi:hypothetical protein
MGATSEKTSVTGCFILFGLVILSILAYILLRYVGDKPIYNEAHTAFLKGDCITADPLYSELIQKVHIFDFGRFKANSMKEIRYCDDFTFATNAGINSLYELTIEHPENPLVEFVDEKAAQLLESLTKTKDYSGVLANEACNKESEFVNAGLILEESTLPLFKFNCSKYLLEAGDPNAAFEHIVGILEKYPQHAVSKELRESFTNETIFCPLTQQMSDSSTFTNNMDNLANIFLDCGTNYTKQGEFGLATAIYESFLIKFPDHPGVETVNLLLPELLIKAARASGSGTIERPNESGRAPAGIARVNIQNDSPHDLRIVFSGPDARIEILPACETCMDYYAVGPLYCPEQGPIGTYDLTPGEFEVLVETINEDDVIPFTGTWDFQGGKAFYTCFFIVTTTDY